MPTSDTTVEIFIFKEIRNESGHLETYTTTKEEWVEICRLQNSVYNEWPTSGNMWSNLNIKIINSQINKRVWPLDKTNELVYADTK